MDVDSAGNVGICTTSPAQKLEVNGGSSYPDIRISATGLTSRYMELGMDSAVQHSIGAFGTGTYLTFKTVGTDRMVIDATGNVGIGTTSPERKLHVFNAESGGASSNANAPLVLENNTHSYVQFLTPTTAESGLLFGDTDNDAGAFTYKHSTNSMHFRTNAVSDRMVIDSSGNVGIGTTSPPSTVLLDLKENSSASDLIIGLTAATGGRSQIRSVAQADNTTSELSFHTVASSSTSEKMRITAGGNVGIGTTSPAYKLEVNGGNTANSFKVNGYVNGSAYGIADRFTLSSGTRLWFYDSNVQIYRDTSTLKIYGHDGIAFETNSNERVRIDSSGNVGIGTTSPDAKLHVNEAGTLNSQTIVLGLSSTSLRPMIQFSEAATAGLLSGMSIEYDGRLSGVNNKMHINGVDSSPKLTVMSGGNVGIGTTSPIAKLHVAGAVSAGGKVSYSKSYSSLDTTGVAIAGLTAGGNGSSALYEFTMYGGNSGEYQRVIYSCQNAGGNWYAYKVIDEGTNNLDVEASASGLTVTFTFKARSATQYYSPRVHVEFLGSNIDTSYL